MKLANTWKNIGFAKKEKKHQILGSQDEFSYQLSTISSKGRISEERKTH